MKSTLSFTPHYSIKPLSHIQDIWDIFPKGLADEHNWLFLSTSGVHGTHATLDEIENDEVKQVTVLVVQPRACNIRYGMVEITDEDIPVLRQLVQTTIRAVAESQLGNM